MANCSVDGLDEFMLSMQQVAELPKSVIDDMLKAGADVAAEAQRKEAAAILRGPYATGGTALATAKLVEQAGGRAITDDGRRILDIEPASLHQRVPLIIGSKKDVDLAEKFLNGEM